MQFNSHYLRLGPRQVPESRWQNILSPGNLECRLWLMKYIRWLQVLIVKIGLVYDLTSVVWWTKVTHKYQNYAEVKLLIAWLSKRKRASLVAQLVKNPPTMQETWAPSLGWEEPLEKQKATHSSILAWRIPWTVESMGHKESDMTEWLSLSQAKKASWHQGSKWWRGHGERNRDKRQSLQLPKRKTQPWLLTRSSSLHGPVKLYFLI